MVPIVIPSYEPDERFPAILNDLAQAGMGPVVVVDDGSGDGYNTFFERAEEIIRPRGGDFVYAHSEVGQILDDIRFCGELRENGRRVNGVVFGALLRDGSVDADATREMVREAHRQGLSTTFHRAIDESADIFSSLQAIMDIGGIDRILTSGGASDAYSGKQTIAEMVAKAAGRISIMAGCGVTAANATAIAAATGIHEIHGSRLEIISAMKSEQASST